MQLLKSSAGITEIQPGYDVIAGLYFFNGQKTISKQAVAHITMISLSYKQPASTDSLAALHLQ